MLLFNKSIFMYFIIKWPYKCVSVPSIGYIVNIQNILLFFITIHYVVGNIQKIVFFLKNTSSGKYFKECYFIPKVLIINQRNHINQ